MSRLRVCFHQATQFNSSSFMNYHDALHVFLCTRSHQVIQLNSILRHSHSLMLLVPFLILWMTIIPLQCYKNIQSVPKKCTPFLKAYISYEYAYISNLFVAYCWKFCSLFFLKISLFFTEKWTPHNKLNERGWKTLVYKSINFYLIIFLRLFGE